MILPAYIMDAIDRLERAARADDYALGTSATHQYLNEARAHLEAMIVLYGGATGAA